MYAGIDTGSRQLGVGLLSIEGDFFRSGVLRSNEKRPLPRILQLRNKLSEFLEEYTDITMVCVEEPFISGRMAHSSLVLSIAFGMVITLLHERGVEFMTIKPSTLKKAAGKGNASKDYMVARALEMWQVYVQYPDEADALWAAYVAHRVCEVADDIPGVTRWV